MAGYSIADFNAIPGDDAETAPTEVSAEPAQHVTGNFRLEDFGALPEVTLRKESRKELSAAIVKNMPSDLAGSIITKVAEAVVAGTPAESLATLTRRVRRGDEYVFASIASAIEETLRSGVPLEGTEVG